MAHPEWDRPVSSNMERSNADHTVELTSVSFTPINLDGNLRPSHRFQALRNGLDRGSIYDLREEHIPKVSSQHARKRKPAQYSNVNLGSLGRVWKYEGEGDIGDRNNDATSLEFFHKRRRLTPANRSQSTKTLSTTLTKMCEQDSGDDRTKQYRRDQEQQPYHLTTPPQSGKRMTSRARVVSLTSKSKAEQTQFQNTAITKHTAFEGKKTGQETGSSNAFINHKFCTTTQDALKFTAIVLARTTLEKLAAFRYTPASDHQTASSTSQGPRNSTGELDHYELINEPVRQGSAQLLSNRDVLLSSSSFSMEALCDDTADKNPADNNPFIFAGCTTHDHTHFGADPSQMEPDYESDVLEIEMEQGLRVTKCTTYNSARSLLQTAVEETRQCQYTDKHYELQSGEKTTLNVLQQGLDLDLGEGAQHIFDNHKPSSNEAFSPSKFVDVIQTHRPNPFDESQIPDEGRQPAHTFHQEHGIDKNGSHETPKASSCRTDVIEDCQMERNEDAGLAARNFPELNSSPACQHYDLEELPRHRESEIENEASDRNGDSSIIEVPLMEPDLDELETVPIDVSRDFYDINEFEEGLEDNDLLGLVSDFFMRQNLVKDQWQQHDNAGSLLRPLLSSMIVGFNPSEPLQSTQSNRRPIAHQRFAKEAIISSRPLTCEPDDEYPMDHEDEDAMLKISELGICTRDSFPPPESLQETFDRLANGEVYDSPLQFSPLNSNSRASHSATCNVTDSCYTDNSMIEPSPRSQKELELLQVAEDEDWQFIRPGTALTYSKVRMASDPSTGPQPAVLQPANPCEELLSSRTRLISDYSSLQTPAPDLISDTAFALLDDSHEYHPLKPFARPGFPALILNHCPVVGFSGQTFLRTCFRIGEMLREGAKCNALGQDAVIELFARVTFSYRDKGSSKQHFQFSDIWHDRPPYPNGVLASYKRTGWTDRESEMFLGERGKVARCLGRLKRDAKDGGWLMHILNIRETDWEEIRWTKRVVSHGKVKTEKGWKCQFS